MEKAIPYPESYNIPILSFLLFANVCVGIKVSGKNIITLFSQKMELYNVY